jgi:hypothetical protein
MKLAGLPEGVLIVRGRIEVRFEGARNAVVDHPFTRRIVAV